MASDDTSLATAALDEILDTERCEVFISHRSKPEDVQFAILLERELNKHGISSFLDVDNIETGESFAHRIIESIKRSRIVVVFFTEEMSTWIHFEASCAFYEQKLFPVALDGVKIPRPYSRVQYHVVSIEGDGKAKIAVEVDKLVKIIKRKLHGTSKHERGTRMFRMFNSFFFSGLNVFFVLIAAALVLRDWDNLYSHVNHLHITLGSVILGGQFFLSLGFARTVAHPGYQQRDQGFKTAEKLFWIWAAVAILQPFIGLGIARREGGIPDWVWLSLAVYLFALVFTGIAYIIARDAHELDARAGQPYKISQRYFIANILFMVGFILMVAVLNLMIDKPVIY